MLDIMGHKHNVCCQTLQATVRSEPGFHFMWEFGAVNFVSHLLQQIKWKKIKFMIRADQETV